MTNLNLKSLGMITVEKTAVSRISAGNIEQSSPAERSAGNHVFYEWSPTGWRACSSDLPGVGAGAETLEETAELIPETMEFHFEGMRRQSGPLSKLSKAIEVTEEDAHA